jgi:hypothetical protein
VVVVTCPISELFCVWVERVGEMLEHGFNAEGENIAQSIKNRFLIATSSLSISDLWRCLFRGSDLAQTDVITAHAILTTSQTKLTQDEGLFLLRPSRELIRSPGKRRQTDDISNERTVEEGHGGPLLTAHRRDITKDTHTNTAPKELHHVVHVDPSGDLSAARQHNQ